MKLFLKDYENCKVKYLIKTSSKLTMAKTNSEVVLGSQNCVFEKAKIGYKPTDKCLVHLIFHMLLNTYHV